MLTNKEKRYLKDWVLSKCIREIGMEFLEDSHSGEVREEVKDEAEVYASAYYDKFARTFVRKVINARKKL
jgi:hypothetical protein